LHAHAAIDRKSPPNLIVVPGGGWIGRAATGARVEAERGEIPTMLAQLHARGTVVASVCTGAMLLAAAGLLRGVPAVTHHGAIDALAAAGARVIRARVVDADRIITGGGVTSGLDVALWIVERFAGAAVASAVEANLEYERRGTVWRGAK
jgi:transcriptional regulator GlxA family with amidase domain